MNKHIYNTLIKNISSAIYEAVVDFDSLKLLLCIKRFVDKINGDHQDYIDNLDDIDPDNEYYDLLMKIREKELKESDWDFTVDDVYCFLFDSKKLLLTTLRQPKGSELIKCTDNINKLVTELKNGKIMKLVDKNGYAHEHMIYYVPLTRNFEFEEYIL